MNKRIFTLLLAALLILTASGCSKSRRFRSRKPPDILATTQPSISWPPPLPTGQAFRFRFLSPSPSRACTTTR